MKQRVTFVKDEYRGKIYRNDRGELFLHHEDGHWRQWWEEVYIPAQWSPVPRHVKMIIVERSDEKKPSD